MRAGIDWAKARTTLSATTRRVAGTFRLDWICYCFSALVALAALVAMQVPDVELISQVSVSRPGGLQIYYSRDGGFSEVRSTIVPLKAGASQSFIASLPYEDSAILRVDPAAGAERTVLCDTRVVLPDGTVQHVDPRSFAPANEVQVDVVGDCAVIASSSSAIEAQARLDLSTVQGRVEQSKRHRHRLGLLLAALSVALLLAAGAVCAWTGRSQHSEIEWTSLGKALPRIYLLLALSLGGLYCLVTPPGAVPDEPAHIAKTIMVENGQWIGAAKSSLDPGLGDVLGPFEDFLNPSKRFTPDQVFAHAERPLRCHPVPGDYPKSAKNYSPTLYAPAAAVLNVACRLQAPTGVFVYGGRFANLALAVLLVFLGLRAAGTHAWPLFAVAMLPTVLFEQASFSPDSQILGLALCLAGLQVGLATKQVRPGRGVEAALLALGLALALSKPGYAWICVGFLFCRPAYQSVERRYWPKVLLLVALPWLIHVAWVLFSSDATAPRPGVDPKANLAAFFNSPTQALQLWWLTFFGEGSDFLWSSLVGRLGWLDVVLHPGAYAVAWAALLASLGLGSAGTTAIPQGARTRPAAMFFAIGAVLLPALPMYLYWTPPGAIMIEGLQGRYLIPSAAFCLVWLSFWAPRQWRFPAVAFVLMAALAMNLDALYRVTERFFA